MRFFSLVLVFFLMACSPELGEGYLNSDYCYPAPAPCYDHPDGVSFGPTRAGPWCGDANGSLPAISLSVPYLRNQEAVSCPNWCFASAVSSLHAYYFGNHVRECELISRRSGTNCCTASACSNPACSQATMSEQAVKMIGGDGMYAWHLPRPLEEDELQTELRNGRPVLAVLRDAPFGAHAMLITAYREKDPELYGRTSYTLLNPPGSSSAKVNYGQIVGGYWQSLGGGAAWKESFWRISITGSGCVKGYGCACH